MTKSSQPLPLLVACFGCNYLSQLCNDLAAQLLEDGKGLYCKSVDIECMDRSSIQSLSERHPLMSVDGCEKACALGALREFGCEPNACVELSKFGITDDYQPVSITKRFKVLKAVYEEAAALSKSM